MKPHTVRQVKSLCEDNLNHDLQVLLLCVLLGCALLCILADPSRDVINQDTTNLLHDSDIDKSASSFDQACLSSYHVLPPCVYVGSTQAPFLSDREEQHETTSLQHRMPAGILMHAFSRMSARIRRSATPTGSEAISEIQAVAEAKTRFVALSHWPRARARALAHAPLHINSHRHVYANISAYA